MFGTSTTACKAIKLEGAPILHRNRHIACSACTEIASIIAYVLENPSPDLSHQSKVREYADGRPTYVPYVKSQQYAEDVLEAVCNSSLVARLTRTEDWLGMPYYVGDDVPVYSNEGPLDKDLFLTCKKLTRRLRRHPGGLPHLLEIVNAHRGGGAPVFICTEIVPDCRWKGTWSGHLSAGLEQVFQHDPSILLRLAPLAAIVVTIPVLVGRSVLGSGTKGAQEHERAEGARAERRGKSRAKRRST